ncbi:type II toxin-antitoxin system HipA family toxin [Caulobacter rhizosphaerae]|uniref:type II toxin-antitoxin system HipA family toxin n=1 Tax=Caulobacter rhizosphaerae TaxID=2010972 RepID=UPI0013D7D9FF|nr:HipA domain-containing protein [Caulobacter rhizosphaerae]GGL35909.1 kinase [Caulobacter rhizosphaerae]
MAGLDVWLGERRIGAITALGGDRSILAFDDAYADAPDRPTLSLAFKSAAGGLLRDIRPTRARVHPYFSNLLPEGPLRDYLAKRAGVNPTRELHLLATLGQDLPGAIVLRVQDEDRLPDVAAPARFSAGTQASALRFSLAGVQLKFSAAEKAQGGLTIPVQGVGGDWIVKLPSTRFSGVSENEFSMMSLAGSIGIEVPATRLLALDEIEGLPQDIGRLRGAAYAVARFDRGGEGERIHIEDFAQVFGVFPEAKYDKASYRNIGQVLWRETGQAGYGEFIRRLVFSALIGNADMHLKNWSLIYRDGRTPALAPAYDFVATTAYLPDDNAALKVARSRAWSDFGADELAALADGAGAPGRLTQKIARETVAAFRETWTKEAAHLPIAAEVRASVLDQLDHVPLARS